MNICTHFVGNVCQTPITKYFDRENYEDMANKFNNSVGFQVRLHKLYLWFCNGLIYNKRRQKKTRKINLTETQRRHVSYKFFEVIYEQRRL